MSLALRSSDLSAAPAADAPLRIGMVTPPWYALPPQGYGGTEAVVAALVDQLVARGHEVTLVAAGENGTAAQDFVPIYPAPPSELLGSSAIPEVITAATAARAFAERDLDLIHDHSLAGPLLAFGRDVPTVVTMHGPVDGEHGEFLARLGDAVGVVSISAAQRRLDPRLHWVGTVHNAIDVSSFPLAVEKDSYVLWIGRFSPDKGAHLAIDAARRAGRRILLAGKLNEPSEHTYFEQEVAPRLGQQAEYVGEADAALKRELFAGARCLVFPIQWEEPFGMVMIEALACGTPVVATRRGSVPEVVQNGTTGLIVDAVDDLAAAIIAAEDLDPQACRRQAEERFDLPVMATGYERVYRGVLERSTPSPAARERAA
ncbi:glycosyltransferase family 4 protein [Aeromicrobium camelliae]|uniref:Glycosyltransferase family 4 protein n=1 Tax=Aeromicrobium camelliae TaxID=1538144 RepID=A0A3N6X4W8_9ACTN|nr:glycosyltransferase family 4 protein [Aeromicrobium camelliae]RQN08708.1 glycosyltransferase family 4 protein [Aeromicrobium camelliae]